MRLSARQARSKILTVVAEAVTSIKWRSSSRTRTWVTLTGARSGLPQAHRSFTAASLRQRGALQMLRNSSLRPRRLRKCP